MKYSAVYSRFCLLFEGRYLVRMHLEFFVMVKVWMGKVDSKALAELILA